MGLRSFILFVTIVVLSLATMVGGTGCANIIPPGGGPRDSLPPVLLKATPADSSRNFDRSTISLTFDEYVQLDNFLQNAIISPVPGVLPNATNKLNTVSIRLKDTLEPNTTYTINFGNSIKDVNEGNVMKEFTYVFSTGPVIDSLTFTGSVLLAETGKPDTTLTVMLHKNPDDSVVINERPRYITKLDGKGNFIFRNLPAGTFYVYALKDDSRAMRYLNRKALFAFADSPVVVRQNTPPVTLYAYAAEKETITTSASEGGRGGADKRLRYQTSVKGNRQQDLLEPFSFRFERPLADFDSSRVQFATDTLFTRIRNHSWSIDSIRKKVTLLYTWKENTLYHLVLAKDFATDTLGQQLLKDDTLSFVTMRNADYGKLSLRLRNLDLARNPVLQLVQNNDVVASFPLTSENFVRELFLPGEYNLRILHDDNKNGVWDPGIFFGRHKQPELVTPIERTISVKPNFENVFEIAL